MVWLRCKQQYFNSKNKSLLFFFEKRSSLSIKQFNRLGRYRFINYKASLKVKSLFMNSWFILLVNLFDNFSLLTWSLGRVFILRYVTSVLYFSLAYYSFSDIFEVRRLFGNLKLRKLSQLMFEKLLFFYVGCFSVFPASISYPQYSPALLLPRNLFVTPYPLLIKASFLVLYLKVSKNNVFLTLTRNGSDVLLSLSGGQTNTKKKKTTLTIFFLLNKVINYLVKKNEKLIHFVVIKSAWYKLANVVLAPLKRKGIAVNYVGFDISKGHGYLRQKKLRRL